MLHHLLRLIRTVLAEIVGVLLRKTVLSRWTQGTGREKITKDNQNLNTNNIIEILLAAAAALLCAAIDYFTKEKENDD